MKSRKDAFDSRRKGLKQQVQLLSLDYDKVKQTLAGNESAGMLEALEQKLRMFEQTAFQLRDCESLLRPSMLLCSLWRAVLQVTAVLS